MQLYSARCHDVYIFITCKSAYSRREL